MIPQRIQYLVGSSERIRILEALSGTRQKQCTLAEHCSIARSTVHRNLEGLQEWGWVRRTEEGYELTPAGESVLAAYREFTDAVATLGEHEPLLQHLGDVNRPPRSALEGCETTVTTEQDPHAPSVAAAEVIRRNRGDPIRILVSGISPITNQAGWDALEAGSKVETVVDESVLQALEGPYESEARDALDHDGFTLRLYPGSIETGLVLAGDEVCVIAHDDNGNAMASLTGSTPEIREWAQTSYDRFHEGTQSIDVDTASVPSIG